jgi:hypothetical protein
LGDAAGSRVRSWQEQVLNGGVLSVLGGAVVAYVRMGMVLIFISLTSGLWFCGLPVVVLIRCVRLVR